MDGEDCEDEPSTRDSLHEGKLVLRGLLLLETAGDVPGLDLVEECLAVDAFFFFFFFFLLLLLALLLLLRIILLMSCCCCFAGEKRTEEIAQSFLSRATTITITTAMIEVVVDLSPGYSIGAESGSSSESGGFDEKMGGEFCVEELKLCFDFVKGDVAVVVQVELVEELVDFGVCER